MSKKEKPVATVHEEPVSTPTGNNQIDQAGEQGTRSAGKKHAPSEQPKREQPGTVAPAASPIEQKWSEP